MSTRTWQVGDAEEEEGNTVEQSSGKGEGAVASSERAQLERSRV